MLHSSIASNIQGKSRLSDGRTGREDDQIALLPAVGVFVEALIARIDAGEAFVGIAAFAFDLGQDGFGDRTGGTEARDIALIGDVLKLSGRHADEIADVGDLTMLITVLNVRDLGQEFAEDRLVLHQSHIVIDVGGVDDAVYELTDVFRSAGIVQDFGVVELVDDRLGLNRLIGGDQSLHRPKNQDVAVIDAGERFLREGGRADRRGPFIDEHAAENTSLGFDVGGQGDRDHRARFSRFSCHYSSSLMWTFTVPMTCPSLPLYSSMRSLV